MDIRHFQEQRLLARGRETGSYADLLYFHLVRRDLEAIARLRQETGGDAAGDRHLYLIADLARGMDVPLPSPADLAGERDIWVYYTLAKYCLQKDRIEDAVAIALASARMYPHDGTVLNIAAKCCARAGTRDLALQLAQSSLRLNPVQQDMESIQQWVACGEAPAENVYLDLFPKYEAVSFYIPVYNVERYIRGAIEGLLGQNYPLHEIVVVDDGSPDRSVAIAGEYPVRIVHHAENRGLAAARNTAFESATSAVVGAIDSDAAPDVGYTKYAMMEFENAAARLAGVGGRLLERYTETPADLWRSLHLGQDPGAWRQYQPRFLYGSNALFRREAVQAVGGFQACHRTNYEDVRLSFDLVERGYALCHTPWAVAYHLRRDTVPSILKTKWNWIYWNRVQGAVFEHPDRLIDQIDASMAEGLALMAADLEAGRRELAYIDYLWPFVDTLLSLAFVTRIQAFPSGHALYVQARVLSLIPRFDAAVHGHVAERVMEEIRPFLLDGEPSAEAAKEPWAEPLEATLEAFHNACVAIGVSL